MTLFIGKKRMKTKSNVLWIDPELVAQKMIDDGDNWNLDASGNLSWDAWGDPLLDILEEMYQLETKVGESARKMIK